MSQSPNANSQQDLQKSLLNISLALQAIESVLPDLFQCYHLALEYKLPIPIINKSRMHLLEIIMPELRCEIERLNALIN